MRHCVSVLVVSHPSKNAQIHTQTLRLCSCCCFTPLKECSDSHPNTASLFLLLFHTPQRMPRFTPKRCVSVLVVVSHPSKNAQIHTKHCVSVLVVVSHPSKNAQIHTQTLRRCSCCYFTPLKECPDSHPNTASLFLLLFHTPQRMPRFTPKNCISVLVVVSHPSKNAQIHTQTLRLCNRKCRDLSGTVSFLQPQWCFILSPGPRLDPDSA